MQMLLMVVSIIGCSVASRAHSSASLSGAPQCQRKTSNCACQTDQGLIDLSQLDSKDPAKPRFQDDDREGLFRYYYNPCTPFDVGRCKSAAMCRCSKTESRCTVIGNHAKDKFYVEQGKLTIAYSEITTEGLLTSHLSLICGESDEPDADFELINSTKDTNFYFTLTSSYACPVRKELSTGSILVIVFCSLLVAYFVGGILFKRVVGKQEGYEMVPNITFWKDFPILVKDGIVFTCSSLSGVRCAMWQLNEQPEEQRPLAQNGNQM